MSKSKWPDARLQLDVTCLVVKTGHDGEDKLLSTEERNALIHKLIEKLGGVQAPGTGVVKVKGGDEKLKLVATSLRPR